MQSPKEDRNNMKGKLAVLFAITSLAAVTVCHAKPTVPEKQLASAKELPNRLEILAGKLEAVEQSETSC